VGDGGDAQNGARGFFEPNPLAFLGLRWAPIARATTRWLPSKGRFSSSPISPLSTEAGPSLRSGDRARSALRSRTRLGSFCCFRLVGDDRSEDPAADRRKGADFARRALEVAGDDPGVLANAALALAYFGEDIDAMMALVDRALALNPNYARGWSISGALRMWAGQPDIAIEHIGSALRLSPRARVGNSLFTIGQAHFHSRRFDEAVPKLLLAIQEDPSFPPPYRTLASCYAHIGRLDDAREIVERLRAITSVVIPNAPNLRNAEHRELLLSGLRLAAGETK